MNTYIVRANVTRINSPAFPAVLTGVPADSPIKAALAALDKWEAMGAIDASQIRCIDSSGATFELGD